ncbi:unnamed protein product [Linum tenue]|uniref:Uncharacterized protein n=1 Tax=Linum tenue TaxID=586396 RepID=A0AAV0NZX7_9ROSI|nr:unnamed protein product [Linum tenue]
MEQSCRFGSTIQARRCHCSRPGRLGRITRSRGTESMGFTGCLAWLFLAACLLMGATLFS